MSVSYGGERYKTFDANDDERVPQPVETVCHSKLSRTRTYHKRKSA